MYIGTYDEYLNYGGKDSEANYYAANPGAPGAPPPSSYRVNSGSSSSGSIPKPPSHPDNWGLDGKVNPIDTEGMHLDPWETVDVPWDPLYIDQYEEWARSKFIERQVQPEDTVTWQMQHLLDDQSPYITSARNRGMRQAASRGLLNSSMAAGAAEGAAIDAALPIAQQDASTYFSQGINNQNLANQFQLARQNAGMTGMMEMDRLKQTLEADFAKFNAEMDLKVESFNSTMDFEAAMAAQSHAQEEKLTRARLWQAADAAYAGAMASMNTASIQAAAASVANYKSGLLDIWNSPNITPEQAAVFADRWATLNGYSIGSSVKWDEAYR